MKRCHRIKTDSVPLEEGSYWPEHLLAVMQMRRIQYGQPPMGRRNKAPGATLEKTPKDVPLWRQCANGGPRALAEDDAMHAGDRVWHERGLGNAVQAGDVRARQMWYDQSFDGLHASVAWRCADRNRAYGAAPFPHK
jgi:hypothetical protein